MFDVSDFVPKVFWPEGWTAWWIMFVPVLGVSVVLWVMGIAGSGLLICAVVGIFVYLATGFCDHIWKVLMRAGMALSVAGFVVLIGAAFAAGAKLPGGSDAVSALAVMRDLAAVPFIATGMAMTTLAGILALFRTDT